MKDDQMDWDGYVADSAKALRLVLEPEWVPAIAANLDIIFKIASAVDGFHLPDDAEPAPIFEA